jgi:acyl carrier protein
MNDRVAVRKLLSIIADFTPYAAEDLKEGMTFVDDLGIDSLDLAQILMAIEDAFDVEIDEDISENVETIGDAVKLLNEYLDDLDDMDD